VEKGHGIQKADGAFFLIAAQDGGYALRDLDGAEAGQAAKSDIIELKPNAGVRGMIATALVQFTLSDPDPGTRQAALESIAKDPKPETLAPLRASIAGESDAALKAQRERLEWLLTLRFDAESTARVAGTDGLGADLRLDLRAALNPLLATTRLAVAGDMAPDADVARVLRPAPT
jgi:urea transport system permease protein